MKKAASSLARRNGRRKNEEPEAKETKQESAQRRKPTAEEAALTAKNYRLAKELSELRVRHRDECKNVTRLTMENMNLASRCREAISHVAMLKKELAMHQRRAAEALAIQRKQQSETTKVSSSSEPIDDNKSPPSASRQRNLSDVAAEMDRMDRILAAHAANESTPNPPEDEKKEDSNNNNNNKILSIIHVPRDENSKNTKNLSITPVANADSGAPEEPPSPKMVDSDDFEFDDDDEDDEEEKIPEPRASSSKVVVLPNKGPRSSPLRTSNNDLLTTEKETKEDEDTVEEPSPRFSDPSFFPHSASPRFHRVSYNEEFPGDITEVSKPAARQKHHILGDMRESDDENPASSSSTSSSKSSPHHGVFETMSKREDKSTMSSIDAFEASFNTNFPDSFSPKDDVDEKKPTSEIYNPFFPSPQKSVRSSDSSKDSSRGVPSTGGGDNGFTGSIRDRAARSAQRMGVKRSKSTDPPAHNRTSPRETPSAKAISTMSPRSFDNSSGRSPPQQRRYSPSTPRATTSSPLRAAETSDDERYRTPPQQTITTPLSAASDQPQRPEKAGYDVARARYEKALMPRGTTARSDRPPDVPSDEKSYPSRAPPEPRSSPSSSGRKVSVKDRVAAFSTGLSPQTQDKDKVRTSSWVGSAERKQQQRVVYPSSDDENEGEIPMITSLSPRENDGDQDDNRQAIFQEPSPSSRPQKNGSITGSALTNGRSRVRPWEDSFRDENEKVEMEPEGQTTTPPSSSRFMNTGKQRRSVKQPTASSYSEPSIKLRRGDLYFPKEEAPVNSGSLE